MRRHALLVVAALLAGCQTPFGFGGEDWGDNVDDPYGTGDIDQNSELDSANTDDAGPTVLASRAFCAEGQPEGMGAVVDGANVWVTHVDFADECSACADWYVGTAATGTDVAITYTDRDDATCDCDCAVQGIEYVMTGFGTGSYTLSAGADHVTVDVGLASE